MSTRHTLHMHVKGFKSIRDQELEFTPLNIFIGGNGAGKSNLLGVLHFLRRVADQQLQMYTGEAGGANAVLHFGRKTTQRLYMKTEFRLGTEADIYEFVLIPTDTDRFVFDAENIYYMDYTYTEPMRHHDPFLPLVSRGHSEALLAETKGSRARFVRDQLDSYRVYHFHDIGPSAPVKQTGDLADNRFFRPDAGNLAAFLYRLQQREPDHFENIEDTIRQVAPFLRRFKLEPSLLNPDKIRLEWEEIGSDTYFGPAALSDGTLRFICLATLLLQPNLPSLILIDEPELGLHLAAIQLLADLLQSAATRTQLIVATQSVTLINQLQPEHVWVADREEGQSVFRHLKSADMSAWLEDYGLGELWEKNIIGGRP